ncbi:MAG: TolB family protein [Actinomycetota bacterium]
MEALGIRTIDSETGESIRQLLERDSREPIWSPDGSRVAFARGYENNLEIWVVDRHGRDATRLTKNHKLDEWPSWAPDSARLVVERYDVDDPSYDNELFVVRADGSGRHRITDNEVDDVCPSWQPGGRRIAFHRRGSNDIYTIRANGERERQITSGPDWDAGPIWAPDGQAILFRRRVQPIDNPAPPVPVAQHDLFVVSKDGTELTRITDTADLEAVYGWSPDGNWIAFVVASSDRSNSSLWVIRLDGTEARELVSNLGRSYEGVSPTWSADSSRILHTRSSETARNSPRVDVWTINVDGSGERALGPTRDAHESSPDWYGSPQECAGAY